MFTWTKELNFPNISSGKYSGIHKVQQEPVTGYKKIACSCEKEQENGLTDSTRITRYMIAQLEIPVGATIVRSKSDGLDGVPPASNLRTDCAIVKNIQEIGSSPSESLTPESVPKFLSSLNNCVCHSMWDKTYRYDIGQEHRPKKLLNTDLDKVFTSGIHFFLNKNEANNY